MRSTWLILLPLFFVTAACGDTTSTPPIDASPDQAVTSDGSTPDGSKPDSSVIPDAAVADSAADDSSIPYEAGSLDQCNPNVPSSCVQGKKCCSEPTHQVPMSAYVCVTPTGNGTCPMLP